MVIMVYISFGSSGFAADLDDDDGDEDASLDLFPLFFGSRVDKNICF